MREIDLDAPSSRITALIYGDLRSGKTRLAATFPKPVFLSDVTESGWKTLQTMDRSVWYDPEVKPRVFGIEKVTDMNEVFNSKILPGIANKTIETIVIDSITFYSDLFFAAVLAAQSKPDNRAAYGALGNHLRDLRVKIQGLNVNVVWLALAKSPDTENPIGMPMIPGQQGSKFPAGCDFVFYMRSYQAGKEIKFELRTKRYGAYVAGGRDSGILPDPIVDPTYRKIMHYLRGGLPEEGDGEEILEGEGEASGEPDPSPLIISVPRPVIQPAKPIVKPTIVRR